MDWAEALKAMEGGAVVERDGKPDGLTLRFQEITLPVIVQQTFYQGNVYARCECPVVLEEMSDHIYRIVPKEVKQ